MMLIKLKAFIWIILALLPEHVSSDTLKSNSEGEIQNVTLAANDAKIISVNPGGAVRIYPLNVSPSVAYIVCQAHTQSVDIILSLKEKIEYATSKQGHDVGVVSVTQGKSDVKWFLYSNSSVIIRVLLHLTYLSGSDPFPGGCNQEFNLENDSNINLHVSPTKTKVQFQWSNTGWLPGEKVFPHCDNGHYQAFLSYQIYTYYIQGGDYGEDTYFNKIKLMLTAKDIQKNGRKVKSLSNSEAQKSVIDVTSYKGQGVIYAVVVKEKNEDSGVQTEAAYIPVVTYACDLQHNCKDRDIAALILSTVGGLVGIFLLAVGHRYFRTENFIFGFLIFGLVFYQIFALETTISYAGNLTLAAMFGLLGGALLLALWWNCGLPILNVLFIAMVGGYLLTSILFYTPFGNLSYWESPFNYGATFACGVLVIPVIFLLFTKTLNILTCTLVGSYGIIVAMDTYLRGGMRYFILNSLRHGADHDYVKVTVSGPFTAIEIALTCVWIVLFACGTVLQLYRDRKKAPFPPCPRDQRRGSSYLRSLLQKSSSEQTSARSSPAREDNQRQPLLRGENQRQYGATQEGSQIDGETESDNGSGNMPKMV